MDRENKEPQDIGWALAEELRLQIIPPLQGEFRFKCEPAGNDIRAFKDIVEEFALRIKRRYLDRVDEMIKIFGGLDPSWGVQL